MKRSKIKLLASVVIFAILLALIGFLSLGSISKPSFGFLGGRSPVVRTKDNNRAAYKIVRNIYSFEGDFNDVNAKAGAELASLGFVEETHPGDESHRRIYQLRNKFPRESATVTVIDKHKCAVYSTPAHSDYSSPDVQTYHYKNGWISIEITQGKRRFGGLQCLRSWLRRTLQGGTSQP